MRAQGVHVGKIYSMKLTLAVMDLGLNTSTHVILQLQQLTKRPPTASERCQGCQMEKSLVIISGTLFSVLHKC